MQNLTLKSNPRWPPCRIGNERGTTIARTFQFKDFPAAMKFVNAVAELAEQAWHHPDIDIRWNKVTLTLTTHDAGGLTEKDFDLARKFDAVVTSLNSPNWSNCRAPSPERLAASFRRVHGRGSRPIQMSPTPWFHSSCGMLAARWRCRRG